MSASTWLRFLRGKSNETEIRLNRLLIQWATSARTATRSSTAHAVSSRQRPWLDARRRNAIFLNFLAANVNWLGQSPAMCTANNESNKKNQWLTSKKHTEISFALVENLNFLQTHKTWHIFGGRCGRCKLWLTFTAYPPTHWNTSLVAVWVAHLLTVCLLYFLLILGP